MKVLQEITEWEDNTPNHIYHVRDDGKLLAYQPYGGGVVMFTKPLMFDRRYRKFKTLKVNK